MRARAVGAGRARATAWRDGRQQAGQLRTDARVAEALDGARVGEGGSQQLHDRAVGDGPLADVRARGEDRAASGADPFDDGLGEPGLADARLADDGGDPARSGRVRRAGCEQLIQGLIPADERSRPAGEHWLPRCSLSDAGPGRRGVAHRRFGRLVRIPDRLVPLAGGRERRHPELAIEDRDAQPVLAKRGGPIARPGVQVHQPDVPGFVEGIEVEAMGGRRDRTRQVACRLVRRGQPVQHRHHGPFHGDRPRRPPIIELRAVAQVEAGQERTASQGGGRGKRPPRIRARRAAPAPRGRPERRRGIERNPSAIDEDRIAPGGRAERRQGPPQRPVRRRRHPHRARATPQARRARTLVPPPPSSARIATALRVSTTSGAPSTSTSGGPSSRMSRRGDGLVGHGVTVLILRGSPVTFQ